MDSSPPDGSVPTVRVQVPTPTAADLAATWLRLRAQPATLKVSVGEDIRVSDEMIRGSVDVQLDPATLSAAGRVEATKLAPELLVGVSLITPGDRTDEGRIILAVAPIWRRLLDALTREPETIYRLDARQAEELVAGAYSEDGWNVTLTPRSGDHGRDVIAERDDVGAIRVLDQVKRYKPGHVVTADEVNAMFGVLSRDPKASKAYITTTSRFAPRVYDEFRDVMPTRLELRDGDNLRGWLARLAAKA